MTRDPGDETNFVDHRAVHHESLKVAGLLDDFGEQVTPRTCPAGYVIADSTASGWDGPLGDSVRCERPRGHSGSHIFTVRWEDNDRPHRD